MIATYVSKGEVVDYTPITDVAAGEVVVLGSMVGVSTRPLPANRLGSLFIDGVFKFPKATGVGTGITVGQQVYWNADGEVATKDDDGGSSGTSDDYVPLGKCVVDASTADNVVHVKINR